MRTIQQSNRSNDTQVVATFGRTSTPKLTYTKVRNTLEQGGKLLFKLGYAMLVNFRGVVEEIHPENEVRENLNKFDLTAFRIVDGEWVKK